MSGYRQRITALSSQILAFRQRQSILLPPETLSLSGRKSNAESEQTEGSLFSQASTTSSTRLIKLAEMERLKVLRRYETQASELEMQAQWEAEKVASQANLQAKKVRFQVDEIRRQGEMEPLQMEVDILGTDEEVRT